jgi:hypothetical protein
MSLGMRPHAQARCCVEVMTTLGCDTALQINARKGLGPYKCTGGLDCSPVRLRPVCGAEGRAVAARNPCLSWLDHDFE